MGRPQPKKHVPQQGAQKLIEVDPNRVIRSLQQQRADLSAQLDLVQAALEESQEREQQMLTRIAELEDKAGESK